MTLCHSSCFSVEVSLITYVSTATESDDQQQQWPETAHQRRRGEALSPAATASSSPHPRPCRARRGERTGLQGARRGGVQAFSLLLLLLLPLLPHSSLLPPLLGCAGALKHSCSAECRAVVSKRQREVEHKVQAQVTPTALLLFSWTNPRPT